MKRTLCALLLALTACSGGGGDEPVVPGDAGTPDGRTPDDAPDAGPSAGTDAGFDAGEVDATPPTTTASPDAAPIRQGAVRVTLTTSEPATTYVTLDGSEPTTASPQYSGPLLVDRTRTIRFFSVDAAGNAEAPQTLRYRIDTVRRLLLDVAAN